MQEGSAQGSAETTLYNTKSARIDPYETHLLFAASYEKE